MKPAKDDLERRRPLWEAVSDLFLDTELDDRWYESIARRVLSSGYCPTEVEIILWQEVFPVLEVNLRHPAGEWAGFSEDDLQKWILGKEPRQSATAQPVTAEIIREAWFEVQRFLPDTSACEVRCTLLRVLTSQQSTTGAKELPGVGATVGKLAQAIYAERAFDRLPILADALEEAGCKDEAILAQCRQGGQSFRGCWVIDPTRRET